MIRGTRPLPLVLLLIVVGGCASKRTDAGPASSTEPAPAAGPSASAASDLEQIMRAFHDRKRYDHLDQAVLSGIADADLVAAIEDYVNDRRIVRDYEHAHAILSKMSKGFQAIHATLLLDAEVKNGGYNQFFWNASGEFAQMALDGFVLLGADRHAELTRKAIAQYGIEEAELRKFKEKGSLEDFSESYKHTKLGDIDPIYFALEKPPAEDLAALQIRFVRAHPEQFVTTGAP